jgi:hypothetical protein
MFLGEHLDALLGQSVGDQYARHVSSFVRDQLVVMFPRRSTGALARAGV